MKSPRRTEQEISLTDLLSREEAQEIVDAIVQARKRAGLTQADIAQAMGITQSSVARLESSATLPRLSTLQRFARATSSRIHLSIDPVSNHDIRTASPTMTDTLTRPGFSTDRRRFLGGAVGLAGMLGFGSIRPISAEEATAAATAVGDYVWTPPAYDPEPALFSVTDRTDDTVTAQTIDGEVVIPASPQRIVALGWEYIALFELGVTDAIVGVTFYEGDDPPLRNVGDLTEAMHASLAEVTLIPNPFELDVEQVVILDPDLILAGPWIEDPSPLAQIAPVIRGKTAALNVPRAAVRDFGDLLNLSTAASDQFSEHEAFVERAREALAPSVSGKKAVAMAFDGESIWVLPSYYVQDDGILAYGSGAYQLHRELSITPSSFVEYLADEDDRNSIGFSLSIEQIRDIDADYIFILDEAGSYDAFVNHPLVPLTEAGQKNQIYSFNAVQHGFGLAGVRAGIAYMVECITGEAFA